MAHVFGIYARRSTGYDAYHGYQASEGSCAGQGPNCYAFTNMVVHANWVRINNAYGLTAPFAPSLGDYYLTDARKSGEVIRIEAPSLADPKDTQENSIYQNILRTFRFERN